MLSEDELADAKLLVFANKQVRRWRGISLRASDEGIYPLFLMMIGSTGCDDGG